MNTYQVWQKAGLRQKVYAREDLDAVYDQAENYWETIESRLMTATLLVDPTYIPRKETIASAGDKFSDIRHNLRMSIRGLFKAYATRNWQWVSSYSVKVNRHYLEYYRALHGMEQKFSIATMILSLVGMFLSNHPKELFLDAEKNKGSKCTFEHGGLPLPPLAEHRELK
jgi:hypothetical protein